LNITSYMLNDAWRAWNPGWCTEDRILVMK
jgi:hypothetical protein